MDGLVARDDARAIDLDPRNASRRRSGRDDDFLSRTQRLSVAFEHVDSALAREACRAFDPVDLVLLEQELDPLGETADDAVLALLHLRHIDGDRRFADRDPPFLRVLHDFQRMRMFEECLGGNASPEQAGAAQGLLFLDDSNFEPQLGGADGGHVPAGAGADDNDVIFVCHSVSLMSARPLRARALTASTMTAAQTGSLRIAASARPASARVPRHRDPAVPRGHATARDRTAIPSTTR